MTSWTKPTPEQVERALALIAQPQHYRRFFEGLKNPEWIVPLREKNVFAHPPGVSRDEVRGTIGFRQWPAARYLAQMAALAPEAVIETIISMPETENVWVHEEFVSAALCMPARHAARVAELEIAWLSTRGQLFMLLGEELAKLSVHLAEGGEADTSIRLLSSVLAFTKNPVPEDVPDDERERSLRSRVDVWHYRNILKKFGPPLALKLGVPAFKAICDILNGYLEVSEKSRAGTGADHSYIWRPAIESHEQNMEGQFNSSLVAGCRDIAEKLLNEAGVPLAEILALLATFKWTVFRRLQIHLIRLHAPSGSDILREAISSEGHFRDAGVRHEFIELLRGRATDIEAEALNRILQRIEAGPNIEKFLARELKWRNRTPDEAEITEYRRVWQRERLDWFGPALPKELSPELRDVLASLPKPEHTEFPFYMSSGWVGPESPKSESELKALPVEELAGFMKSWEPPAESRMEANRRGLGQVVGNIIKENPAPYADTADSFQGLDATYVRALIDGFEQAMRNEKAFPCEKILSLCEWAVAAPREISGRDGRGSDDDPHWGWARQAIASLLRQAFSGKNLEIASRPQAWRILSAILRDPDPPFFPAETERRPEEDTKDGILDGPETVSINTPRGQAMHAVIQYALWVRRSIEAIPDSQERLQRGFEEMPEVREALAWHLDSSKDAAPAIRSVYGQWFPWLVLLDPTWTKTNVDRIFPATGESPELLDAAWSTYLAFCRPFDNVLEIISEIYARAITSIAAGAARKRRHRDPQERLGEHLVAFYWRGKLDLAPGSLIVRYLETASDELRANLVEHVGRSLANSKGKVPPEVIDRCVRLWEWMRAQGARIIGPRTAASFGWWFAANTFSEDWVVPHVAWAAKAGLAIDPEHLVAENLVKVSKKWPLEAVAVFDVVTRNDKDGWKTSGWRKEVTAVLEEAYRSENKEARQAAIDFIQYLGTRGYFEFGKILA